jgi:hypothetical protein
MPVPVPRVREDSWRLVGRLVAERATGRSRRVTKRTR